VERYVNGRYFVHVFFRCSPPPRDSPEFDLLPLFLDLRIIGDGVGYIDSILEDLVV